MLHPCVSRCSRRFGARCIFFLSMHTHTVCDVRLCYDFFVCRETSILSCCCCCRCRCCTAGTRYSSRLSDCLILATWEEWREGKKKTFGYDGFLFFYYYYYSTDRSHKKLPLTTTTDMGNSILFFFFFFVFFKV